MKLLKIFTVNAVIVKIDGQEKKRKEKKLN